MIGGVCFVLFVPILLALVVIITYEIINHNLGVIHRNSGDILGPSILLVLHQLLCIRPT